MLPSGLPTIREFIDKRKNVRAPKESAYSCRRATIGSTRIALLVGTKAANKVTTIRVDPSRPIKSWRSAWRAALKRAGLQLRFQDLRHTCITKLAESRASEQTLMAISGHVSRKMIEHYSHIRMDAKRRATNAIVEGGVNQNVKQPSASDSSIAGKSLN
jgi:integrase